MRASESVLVVSELLCTGVQANTERHTKERNARNVLMLGIQTTLVAWYLSCTYTLATCHCTGYDRVLVVCSEIDIDARVELPGRDDG